VVLDGVTRVVVVVAGGAVVVDCLVGGGVDRVVAEVVGGVATAVGATVATGRVLVGIDAGDVDLVDEGDVIVGSDVDLVDEGGVDLVDEGDVAAEVDAPPDDGVLDGRSDGSVAGGASAAAVLLVGPAGGGRVEPGSRDGAGAGMVVDVRPGRERNRGDRW